MKLRCAILDDYQGVALDMADWGRLSPEVEVQVFREKIDGLDNLVRALKDFENSLPDARANSYFGEVDRGTAQIASDNVDGRPKPVD